MCLLILMANWPVRTGLNDQIDETNAPKYAARGGHATKNGTPMGLQKLPSWTRFWPRQICAQETGIAARESHVHHVVVDLVQLLRHFWKTILCKHLSLWDIGKCPCLLAGTKFRVAKKWWHAFFLWNCPLLLPHHCNKINMEWQPNTASNSTSQQRSTNNMPLGM